MPHDNGGSFLAGAEIDPYEESGAMKFIHMADVHLGCEPDGRTEWAQERKREIWETFCDSVADAERKKADLVLIAGDLFHRPPETASLREVNYLLGSYPGICFAMIAGNHDCCSPGSAWEDFEFAPNVAFLGSRDVECIRFPALACEVYGFSYDRSRIAQNLYDRLHPSENDFFHILLAHGGDRDHIPIDPRQLALSGFDYIALGHIHKPTVLLPGKALYPGALSPIDAGDEGEHGYLEGETHGTSVQVHFVPKALREYVTLEVPADESDTVLSMRDRVRDAVERRGKENIYKIVIRGQRHPAVWFDTELIRSAGMILEVKDESVPALHIGELKERFRGQLIGRYIESFETAAPGSVEEKALRIGLEALLSE